MSENNPINDLGGHVLCRYLGGSHLYGLNTPESDSDERGVFVNSDPAYILGTKRFDEYRNQCHTTKTDIVYKELSAYMRLLKSANSEAIELLFAPVEAFTVRMHDFAELQNNYGRLVDSERLYKCLKGYIQSETRLALGDRKGQIGGSRYETVKTCGYSPKNLVQLLRLAHCGASFYRDGWFPTRLSGTFRDTLLDLKTQKPPMDREGILALVGIYEHNLDTSYRTRCSNMKFNEDYANDYLLRMYKKYL